MPESGLNKNGELKIYQFPEDYQSYTIGGDVAEGIEGGDWSVLYVINNKTLKCVAKYRARLSPDKFAVVAFAVGLWYNKAYLGVEVNKDGLWVNTELFKMGYTNLYYRETLDDITNRVSAKVGFKTDERTRPYILSEIQKMLTKHDDVWTDREFLQEALVFVRNRSGRPEAMNGKNDDIIISAAIAYEIRRNAPVEFDRPPEEEPLTGQNYVKKRLETLYKKKNKLITQQDFSVE